MSLDEAALEQVAQDGEMDYAKWPKIIEPLLDRLSHIVYNDFAIPKPYPIVNPILPSQNHSTNPDQVIDAPATLVSQTPTTPRTLPPVPPFPGSSTSNVPDSQPPHSSPGSTNDAMNELPAELLQLLNSTINTLRTAFSERPPHTIQRLAELILRPNKHYKTLPAWLRAVDRVISVSSTADIFPLNDTPPLINGVNGEGAGGILWSNNNGGESRNGYDKESLGSDESLGGALLTPIPWLKDIHSASSSSEIESGSRSSSAAEADSNSKIQGWQEGVEDEPEMLGDPIDAAAANAAADAAAIASVAEEQDALIGPGREGGGVTQGELMRMEQEAGVIPATNPNGQNPVSASGRGFGTEGVEMDDEGEAMPPHARGPDVVGTVDMGLVGGEEREVRLSASPPDERRTLSDPNDAQTVLEGGEDLSAAEPKPTTGSGSSADSDGYVDLGKDEMQLDIEASASAVVASATSESSAEIITGSSTGTDTEGDGDIVLVDADGAAEDDQDQKADASGVNIGADASDTTAQ